MGAPIPLLFLASCVATEGNTPDLDLRSARRIDLRAGRPKWIHGSWEVATADPAEAVLAAVAQWPELGVAQGDLQLSHTRVGLAGLYLTFEQHIHGVPVIDGQLVARVVEDPGGVELTDLNNATRDLGDWHPPGPRTPEDEAIALAEAGKALRAPSLARLMVADGPRLVWRVDLVRTDGVDERVLIDAMTGEILERADRRVWLEGSGYVFDPNPMGSSGDTTLRDGDDANQDALTAELQLVALPRLDGTEVLRGTWVDTNPDDEDRATDASHSFLYDRADDSFEEVMAYYHVDRAQDRLQELGFTDVNARQQEVVVNGTSDDSSWYSPTTLQITLGSGGVDDGEDADIVVHEYGHALQDDQVPGFGGGDEGALGEGFGDYLAASFADTLSAQVLDPHCVAEWDASSYAGGDPPCLRRTDSTLHYPEAAVWEVHDDGEMWSAALMSARALVGADVMDSLVVEHHFLLSTSETFFAASAALLATEEALYGGAYQDVVRRSLVEKGVSRELTPSPDLPDVIATVSVEMENTRTGSEYDNDLDESQSYTSPGALGLRLHFAEFSTELDASCVEGACDNVYLSNGDGDLFEVLSGPLGDFESVIVEGDTVEIRLVTDASVPDYGYLVDRIDIMGDLCVDDDGDLVDACTDCDDGDAGNYPGNVEVCDGQDDDCTGVADDGLPTTDWYVDGDGDGFGAGTATASCEAMAGAVEVSGDCDDGDSAVYPGAAETACDSVDNDCDAGTQDAVDADGDGVDACTDCDDDDDDGSFAGTPGDCDAEDEADDVEEDDDGRACGCASASAPAMGWLVLPLLLVGRRRRVPARSGCPLAR